MGRQIRIRGKDRKRYQQSKLDRSVLGYGTDNLEIANFLLRSIIGSPLFKSLWKRTTVRAWIENVPGINEENLDVITDYVFTEIQKSLSRDSGPMPQSIKEKVALIIRAEKKLNKIMLPKYESVKKILLVPKLGDPDNKLAYGETLNRGKKLLDLGSGTYGFASELLDFIHFKDEINIDVGPHHIVVEAKKGLHKNRHTHIGDLPVLPTDIIRCSHERKSRIIRFRKEMWDFIRGGDLPNGKLL